MYATAFEYNLERFVVTIYATGPLGVLVAYFVLSPTKTAAESVAASAFGSKWSFVMTAVRASAEKFSQGNVGVLRG